MKVYIWDMDETLILLKSLLNETYAGAFNGLKNVKDGVEIGKLWEDHILRACDEYFFYEQIEDANQPYIDIFKQYDDGIDLSEYNFKMDCFGPPIDSLNMRKLAYRHRVIAENYRKGLHNILSEETIKLWNSLYDLTDTYTERWLSSARTCLQECAGQDMTQQHVNVLVTSGPLVPSLVKCLFFRFDNVFTCDNVYSSLEVGKLKCFSLIKERFNGPNVEYCVIGDGWEECEAAESMKWPFVKIDPHPTSIHRFPGLTPTDLKHYFDIIYGTTTADEDDDERRRRHSTIAD